MNERRNRQLSGIIGVFLVVVAGSAFALLGDGALDAPVLLAQIGLLGLAGLCDIAAVRDTVLTDLLAWYRWSGLGNVFLGLSLPLGLLDSVDVLLVVVAIGGLSLAAMGIDMLVFHGKYTRGERLDARTE